MKSTDVVEKIEKIVIPYLDDLNLSLVDIEYLQEGGYWYVRIFIENMNGDLDVEDCAKVSHLIENDVENIIEERFFLEVSSPGLERPLKKIDDFIRFKQNKAKIVLKKKLNNKNTYIGIIDDVSDNVITLNTEEEIIKINFNDIKKSNLVFEFTDF